MMISSKLLSVFAVSLLMIGGVLAVLGTAQGDGDTFDGSEVSALGAIPSGAIPVSDAADLARVGTGVTFGAHIWRADASYYLTANIVLTGTNNFTPIGTMTTFTGSLYGQGHTISGLHRTTGTNVGLFASTNGATILDVNVTEATFTASAGNAGGIVGSAASTTITNCSFSGTITASGNAVNAGGIVGQSSGNATISGCYVLGAVTATQVGNTAGSNTFAGGIIGQVSTTSSIAITNCYNIATVTSSTSSANPTVSSGGIVGGSVISGNGVNITITITNCYNTGNISSSHPTVLSRSGGIFGWGNQGGNTTSSISISVNKCYNDGNIASNISSGGIVGTVSGLSNHTTTINNCYNTGNISAGSTGPASATSAGIVGSSTQCTISNCYSTGTVSTTHVSPNSSMAGGIATSGGSGVKIINCYFLSGQIKKNGVTITDIITDRPNAVIDGSSVPNRIAGQDSGAKSSTQMSPTLSTAQAGTSIFFTGTTNNTISGWNFNTIWTIVPSVSPYPLLIGLVPSIDIKSTPTNLNILSEVLWTYTINATAGGTPTGISYAVSGAPWLSFSGNVLSGTAPILNVGEVSRAYNVTITASKANFPNATQSFTITVFSPTDSGSVPVPVINITQVSGYTFTFDGSQSSDNIDILWNFGDGNTSTSLVVQHTYKYSGVYTVSLTIANEIGTATVTKTLVVFDNAPLEIAYRGALYQTTIQVHTLASLNFSSTASWLNVSATGQDPTTGNYYVIISGVTPTTVPIGSIYAATLTTSGDTINWNIEIFPAASDTLAYFIILSNTNGTVTIRNNSANATLFTWYWDHGNNPSNFSLSGDPVGIVSHTYTQSGTYVIQMRAAGLNVDYWTETVTVTVTGGGGGNNGGNNGLTWLQENPIVLVFLGIIGAILMYLGAVRYRPLILAGIVFVLWP